MSAEPEKARKGYRPCTRDHYEQKALEEHGESLACIEPAG